MALPSQSIFGSNSADILSSVKGSPVAILALQGDDIVISQNADDYVYAGQGADTIRLNSSVASANLARGGEGNDSIFYGNDTGFITQDGETICSVQGDKGNDAIIYVGAVTNIVDDAAFGGGQGADTISFIGEGNEYGANLLNSTITGGMNNDLITVKATRFTDSEVNGAKGADTISYDADGGLLGTVYGGLGNDVISLAGQVGKVMGGLGKDTITAAVGTVGISVNGGGGDDLISLDTFRGIVRGDGSVDSSNDGKDVITLTTFGGGQVYGDGQADSITVTTSVDTTVGGGLGGDTISVTSTALSTINGGYGNDSITASDHTSVISGGFGNDTIVSTNAGSTITGGDNNDRIVMGVAGNSANLDGGNGADAFVFASSNKKATISGGAGNDTLTYSAQDGVGRIVANDGTAIDGVIAINGGAGSDTYAINGATALTEAQIDTTNTHLFLKKGSGDNIFLNEVLNGDTAFAKVDNVTLFSTGAEAEAAFGAAADNSLLGYQSNGNTFFYLRLGADAAVGFSFDSAMYDASKAVNFEATGVALATVGLTSTVTADAGISFGVI